MTYNKINWNETKSVNPTRLNVLDDGISAAHDLINNTNQNVSNNSNKIDENKNSLIDVNEQLSDIMQEGFDTKTYNSSMNQLENCKGGSLEVLSIKGETKVNPLGKKGTGTDLTGWSTIGAVTQVGDHFNIVASGTGGSVYMDGVQQEIGKYYVIQAEIEVVSYASGSIGIQVTDDNSWLNGVASNVISATTSGYLTVGLKVVGRNLARLLIGERFGSGTCEINLKHISQVEISQDEYDNSSIEQILGKYKYFEDIQGSLIRNIKTLSLNWFDKNTVLIDKMMKANKTIGDTVSGTFCLTQPIEVKEGMQLTLSGNSIFFTDGNWQHYCSSTDTLFSANGKTITIPSGINGYVQLNINLAGDNIETVQLVEGSTVPTEYTKFDQHTEYIAKEYKSYDDIVTESINYDFSEFNLFDSSNITWNEGSSRWETPLLPILKVGKDYIIDNPTSNTIQPSINDTGGVWVRSLPTTNTTKTFAIASNEKYIKFNFYVSDGWTSVEQIVNANIQLNEGSTVQPYKTYQQLLPIPIEAHGINGQNDTIEKDSEGRNTVIRRNKQKLLDGSFDWVFNRSNTGNKVVMISKFSDSMPITNFNSRCIKNDDKLLKVTSGVLADMNADEYRQHEGDNSFFVSLDNAATGWADGYTPTQQEIKDFFNSNNYNLLYNTKEEYYEEELLNDYADTLPAFESGHIIIGFDGVCPEVTVKYAINIAAVRESMANLSKTNSEQINILHEATVTLSSSLINLSEQIIITDDVSDLTQFKDGQIIIYTGANPPV